LLASLKRANYAGAKNITLIISIDSSNSDDVYAVARRFEWLNGEKKIIRHEQNIGLRKHIISCGDLTDAYGSVIILEDDMYVGPAFYSFAAQALEKYRTDAKIAGLSLYSYAYNEFAGAPFMPVADGFDAYFMQVPSSLGQIWTKKQWNKFKNYYNHAGGLAADHKIPPKVYNWPTSTSWKKYFYKYMAENNLYFVFPKVSHATNFGDIGTHFTNEVQFFQVPISYCPKTVEYKLPSSDESSNKYDAFWEPQPELLKSLGIDFPFEYEVDLYGLKNLDGFDKPYFLSIKPCREPRQSFGLRLMPPILNIADNIHGTDFAFAAKNSFLNKTQIYNPLINKNLQISGYLSGYREGRQSVVRSAFNRISRYFLRLKKLFVKFLPSRRNWAQV
jgi:hypothetical protein